MGWFGVRASENRFGNMACLIHEHMQVSTARRDLNELSELTDRQINRAQTLLQRAQGQSSSQRYSHQGVVKSAGQLAAQLGRAVQDGRQFKQVIGEGLQDLTDFDALFDEFHRQYELPRVERTLRLDPRRDVPPSGREIVQFVNVARVDVLDHVGNNINTSVRFLQQAAADTNEADAMLNGRQVQADDVHSVIQQSWLAQSGFGR